MRLKITMNKKAQEPEKVLFIFLGLFSYIFMFMALIWIFSKYSLAPTITHDDLYILVYKQRFLDSPECFAYEDPETGNVYPGIIDKAKFTDEILNNCFKENKESAYEFALVLDDKTISTSGFRRAELKLMPTYVLVHDENKIKKGSLVIAVQGIKNE